MPTAKIGTKVREAARYGKKIAMFHYQILIHADELKGVDAVKCCKEIGVPESYATEFRKMISLAELMKEQGVALK